MSIALVTAPATRVFAQNPISYQLQSAGFAGLDNYRVVLQVLFETVYDSGNYIKLVELEDSPDKAGFTNWNIQAVIEAALKENTELQVPSIGESTPYLADNLRRFRIAYAEKYGQPAAVQSFTNGPIATAYQGGIDQISFAQDNYIAGIDISRPFFTWMPDGQKVGAAQPAYLSWFNYTGSTVRLVAGWQAFSALGDAVQTGTPRTADVPAGRVLVIPVGPAELGITNAAARKYKITLLDENNGDSPVAPDRFYYIDQMPAQCKRYLLWMNGFNLPETLRLTGRTTIGLNVSRQEFIQSLPVGFDPLDGEIKQYRSEWSNTYIYRTGYLRKAVIEVLQDMLINNQIFEIEAGSYFRMHLTGQRYSITECLQFLHSLQLEAIRSIKAINFSKVPSASGTGFWAISNTGNFLTASGDRWELS